MQTPKVPLSQYNPNITPMCTYSSFHFIFHYPQYNSQYYPRGRHSGSPFSHKQAQKKWLKATAEPDVEHDKAAPVHLSQFRVGFQQLVPGGVVRGPSRLYVSPMVTLPASDPISGCHLKKGSKHGVELGWDDLPTTFPGAQAVRHPPGTHQSCIALRTFLHLRADNVSQCTVLGHFVESITVLKK